MRLWLRPALLGLHAFAVVAVGFCAVAGLWQLGLYDSRQDVAQAHHVSEAPVLTEVWGPDDPFLSGLENRMVIVEGRFANPSEQIWVDGRESEGRSGGWLVAPLVVDGTDSSLLVVRGWYPAPGPRHGFPAVPPGDVSFPAVLQASEGSGAPFDATIRTIGTLSIPALTNVLEGDLYSGFAIATSPPGVANALTPVEPPDPNVAWTVGLRNLAYSLQWWVFGAFALFMWWRMASENVAANRSRIG